LNEQGCWRLSAELPQSNSVFSKDGEDSPPGRGRFFGADTNGGGEEFKPALEIARLSLIKDCSIASRLIKAKIASL
jgi:hypothetical protein